MKWILALLVAGAGLVVAPGHARADDDADDLRFARWIHGGLLDPAAPIEQRRAVAAELEAIARDDSDPVVLYLLGSLYRQDPTRSSSPLEQDLDRARELLSRAALHGRIPAMAKLSTIELQAGNRFDANVWAQLHYHYAKEQAQLDPRWTAGFAASILRNALVGFPDADFAALNESVGAMINQHDAKIRAGLRAQAEAESKNLLRDARPGKRALMNAESTKGRRLESGMAEYVLEFAADGTVKQLWTIDAWPNAQLARILRNMALGFRVSPAVAVAAAGKLAILPVAFEDGRYKIRDEPGSD